MFPAGVLAIGPAAMEWNHCTIVQLYALPSSLYFLEQHIEVFIPDNDLGVERLNYLEGEFNIRL